jgi:hypothetical protein
VVTAVTTAPYKLRVEEYGCHSGVGMFVGGGGAETAADEASDIGPRDIGAAAVVCDVMYICLST